MKKRILTKMMTVLLALILVLGLTACSDEDGSVDSLNGANYVPGNNQGVVQNGSQNNLDPSSNGGSGLTAQVSDSEYGLEGGLFHYGLVRMKCESNGKWGYKNKNNEWVIAPIFQSASDFFNHGYAYVREDSSDHYRLIDPKGQYVGEWRFATIDEPSKNGYIAGTVYAADGTKYKEDYYKINSNGEVTVYPVDYDARRFEDNGYAIIYTFRAESQSSFIIDSDFHVVLVMPENYLIGWVTGDGLLGADYYDDDTLRYGVFRIDGSTVKDNLPYASVKRFDEQGYGIYNDCVVDCNLNTIADPTEADPHLKYIEQSFAETDWVRVNGQRFDNADGVAYNFMNRDGEFLFACHLYQSSGYSDVGAMQYGYFVGEVPYKVTDSGEIVLATEDSDILQTKCATAVLDANLNILFWTSDLKVKNTDPMCADGYFRGESYDEYDVVVSAEGKIVVTGQLEP